MSAMEYEVGEQAVVRVAAEQAVPTDAAELALPGRWRRPLEGGWDGYTQ
jgi:hypothetical protein